MELLSAKNLSLNFATTSVVANANLAIHANEFIGLIGPNGAGKSSLLRMLAGLIQPKSGSVNLSIANTSSEKIPAQLRARFMAYLAQHETPAWPLSVKNLVALGRLPWNSSINLSSNDEVAINNALTMTDLSELVDRPVTELSGGELQRVLLARVFAGNPQLILADEPIAALDVYHQLHIMELLQAHAQTGGAVIAALHDLSLAARFCTRLILIDKGSIVADGSPATVLTETNIEKVYGVRTYVECREDSVMIIPRERISSSSL